MRAIAFTLVVIALLPWALRRPEIGAYLWAWISIMNPHKLTYGFAYSLPFAQIVALITILGLLLKNERKPLPLNGGTVTMLLLLAWMTLTSFFAVNTPAIVWDRWLFVLKIYLMLFVTLMLLRGREQIDRLIWVVVVSLGFYGVKGGIFTLMTGGGGRVWGPPGGMIADNNSLAVALVLLLPLMYYLWQTDTNRWVRRGLLISMVLVGLSILGSQSRGAFLALSAMVVVLGLKGKHPIRVSVFLAIAIVVGTAFMPDSWTARMSTIQTYQDDGSAMSRIYTWRTLWNAAVANPLVGVGFGADNVKVFAMYAPTDSVYDSLRGGVWVAHSSYFQALGEHGFPGLLLYLLIWIWIWVAASKAIMSARADAELAAWVPLLMRMCQAATVGFCVGTAFLSLMHLDLPFYLVGIVVLTQVAVRERLQRRGTSKPMSHRDVAYTSATSSRGTL